MDPQLAETTIKTYLNEIRNRLDKAAGEAANWPYLGGCNSPVNQPTASDFIGSSDGMAICSA